MGRERFSEVEGLRAVWRVTRDPRGRIEICAVYDSSVVPSRTIEFRKGTDLAAARELFPRWEALWDCVQHEFWTDIDTAAGASATPRSLRRT